jgi:recombinational DNA repair protein (RecF pathway)
MNGGEGKTKGSVCARCTAPIEGVKFATEDAGVLCGPCARRSHAIPNPWFDALSVQVRRGSGRYR